MNVTRRLSISKTTTVDEKSANSAAGVRVTALQIGNTLHTPVFLVPNSIAAA
jgi:hypothetical protein